MASSSTARPSRFVITVYTFAGQSMLNDNNDARAEKPKIVGTVDVIAELVHVQRDAIQPD